MFSVQTKPSFREVNFLKDINHKNIYKPTCKQAHRQLLLPICTTLRVKSTQRHKQKKHFQIKLVSVGTPIKKQGYLISKINMSNTLK